jgi:hypothetical protein
MNYANLLGLDLGPEILQTIFDSNRILIHDNRFHLWKMGKNRAQMPPTTEGSIEVAEVFFVSENGEGFEYVRHHHGIMLGRELDFR